jgi:hypothetical protein
VNIPVRYIVAAALLVFSWRGAALNLEWPPSPLTTVEAPKPPAEMLEWAKGLEPLLPKMLPADRQYLAAFYDAMAFILMKDGDRSTPIVGDTEAFAVLHAGSLQLAIEKGKVGKYPGLDDAIDTVFFAAAGADVRAVDKDVRARLVTACGVLSYTLAVKHE